MQAVDFLAAIAIGSAHGLVYAVYGIITKRQSGEPLKPKKAFRTVVLFTAAGALVALRDGALAQGNIVRAQSQVAVLGILADMAYSAARRRGWLDALTLATETGS